MKTLEEFLLVFYQDICLSKCLNSEKKYFYLLSLEQLLSTVCRKKLELRLSLIFFDSVARESVCMITQNKDIRPEFRVGFTAEDLICSFLGSFDLMSITSSGVKLFEQWQDAVGDKGEFFGMLLLGVRRGLYNIV